MTLDSLTRVKLSGTKAADFDFSSASKNVANAESVGSTPTTKLRSLYHLVNNMSIPSEDLIAYVEGDEYQCFC